ncbi:MAG TPA: protein translocase subunit SecF [Bryobacteraceae bacterium]|jgi:preprotein translocase subunit SecF|nr:protein translocase subunit SecF [Bryobacteraceae bacterium]
MELFKNTNFDFLGWKWPFIGASLVLSVAGLISLAVKGGPRYGIDFKGGALMHLRFNEEPPVQQIRNVLSGKVRGEVSVQQVTGRQEVEVGTEIADEKELNVNRTVIEDTLRSTFGGTQGKLDVNNSSSEQLANRLRDPLLQAGVALSEQDLQDVIKNIEDFRASKGGILSSFDQLSSVKGVTPAIIQALKKECTLGPFTILSAEVVGPKVGKQLTRQAILATLYALGGMLVYIAFRFEWIYGVAAVVAVFHDTIITIGLFSITNEEISLTVVAALLTLVGYSMNDTIVVFDRIRENLKLMRRESLTNLINISVNQTLSRTVLTSGLTLLTALSLFLFGGQVLHGFSFALVVGIIIGTYSSVFVASPILIFWQNVIESRKGGSIPPPAAPAKEPVGTRRGSGR